MPAIAHLTDIRKDDDRLDPTLVHVPETRPVRVEIEPREPGCRQARVGIVRPEEGTEARFWGHATGADTTGFRHLATDVRDGTGALELTGEIGNPG